MKSLDNTITLIMRSKLPKNCCTCAVESVNPFYPPLLNLFDSNLRNTASEINPSQMFRTGNRIAKNWSIGRYKIHHTGRYARLPAYFENRPIRQQRRIARFPQYRIALESVR